MAINKPTTPSATLPDNWGGTQTAYTSSQIQNGYEEAVPQIVDGGNINYEKKGLFTNIKYLRTIVDFIRNTPIGKTLFVNSNNQLDYITPANDSNTVHKTGDEEISGIKQFNDRTYLINNTTILPSADILKGTVPSTTQSIEFNFVDKNGRTGTWQDTRLAGIHYNYLSNGVSRIGLHAYKNEAGSSAYTSIMLGYDSEGQPVTTCPTPTKDTTSSTQIDTVGARNTKLQNYVDKSSNENIAGNKTFMDNIVLINSGSDKDFVQRDSDYDTFEIPQQNRLRSFRVTDKNGRILGDVRVVTTTTGTRSIQLTGRSGISGSEISGVIALSVLANGRIITQAPEPLLTSKGTEIATTNFTKTATQINYNAGVVFNNSLTTTEISYTAPSDGYIITSYNSTSNNSVQMTLPSGIVIEQGASSANKSNITIPILKEQTIKLKTDTRNCTGTAIFYPLKGA